MMQSTTIHKTLLNEFEHLGTKKKLISHHSLINKGDKVNKVYLVLSGGLVLLHVHPKTGVERAVNFFLPDLHNLASIAEHFYLNTPSIYHLKTFTNSTLIEIKKTDFEYFLATSEHSKSLQEYGIRTLIEKNTLRTHLISLKSGEMLAHLHSNYPQIIQQVPSKYIANFLGISPQWLSKLKRII